MMNMANYDDERVKHTPVLNAETVADMARRQREYLEKNPTIPLWQWLLPFRLLRHAVGRDREN